MTDDKKPEEQLMKLWTDSAKATADAMSVVYRSPWGGRILVFCRL